VGTVTVEDTGAPLPGAAVYVEGTTVGATTDANGRFQITNVPAGEPSLVASFLGFAPDTTAVALAPGGRVSVEFVLAYVVVGGEEVVVTAQIAGQAAAINQQVASNQIVNVVSADRIQEVPDANAAESVARLPGISIQRDAGEGSKVVVRGLSPRFTNVTVNGQRVPSTDLVDRSVDLSTVSQDVLAGIEVYKALTPDQDGDAIGGTVNLTTQAARPGFNARASAQGGYHGLVEGPGQYRFDGTLSRRFFDDRLGAILTGGLFRADRTSRQIDAAYEDALLVDPDDPDAPPDLEPREVVASLRDEVRDRYTASLGLDFDLGATGTLFYNGVYARTERDQERYILEAIKSLNSVNDRFQIAERDVDLVTNNLRGEHVLFGRAELSWSANHAASTNDTPRFLQARFVEGGGFDTERLAVANESNDPYDVLRAVRNRYERKSLRDINQGTERTTDREITGQVDLQVPFDLGPLAGFVKTGAKVRDKSRERESEGFGAGNQALTDSVEVVRPGLYSVTQFGRIGVDNFRGCSDADGGCVVGEADYIQPGIPGPLVIDAAGIEALWDAVSETDALMGGPQANAYGADERVSAGYVMAELNLGPRLMVLPGVRYEYLDAAYSTNFVIGSGAGGSNVFRDSTATPAYGAWLPMVHLRVRPTDAFDVRLAATRTLARPNFFNLVPYRFVGEVLRQGNPDLVQATAWNYDAVVSLFTPALGLVSVGGFYKDIADIEYTQTGTLVDPDSPYNFFSIEQPANADESTTVYGFEVDVQTSLRYLPSPFDGVVLNANYTRVFSETAYPTFDFLRDEDDVPVLDPDTSLPIPVYGERIGPAPGQSDHVLNASLGYERGGFSGRASVTYQSSYLAAVARDPARDAYTDDFTRWDVAVRQRVAGGLSLLGNLINVTNLPDRSFTGIANRVSNEEYFGWIATLGVRQDF
jgi:TonB-dependent receptor